MEDHEGVLVGVAAEEEGTGVAVKWVGDEPHWASDGRHHHLDIADYISKLHCSNYVVIKQLCIYISICSHNLMEKLPQDLCLL